MLGDCYREVGQFMIKMKLEGHGGFTVVHGEVVRDTDGLHHVHAWIEYGDLCLNISKGERLCFPRDIYYEGGHIQRVVRYDEKTYGYYVNTHKTWGPWDLDLCKIQQAAIAAEEKAR
jgi:hypothetical protein